MLGWWGLCDPSVDLLTCQVARLAVVQDSVHDSTCCLLWGTSGRSCCVDMRSCYVNNRLLTVTYRGKIEISMLAQAECCTRGFDLPSLPSLLFMLKLCYYTGVGWLCFELTHWSSCNVASAPLVCRVTLLVAMPMVSDSVPPSGLLCFEHSLQLSVGLSAGTIAQVGGFCRYGQQRGAPLCPQDLA